MNKRILAVTLVTAFVLCGCCSQANAQQECLTSVQCQNGPGACAPAIPATSFNCKGSGNYQLTCSVKNTACHPAPECPTCNLHGGKPIDMASGDTYISQRDLSVPGLGGGLNLSRTWNSLWPDVESGSRIGLFGPNWRSTYEERIVAGGDGYMKYSRNDGGFWSFGYSGYDGSSNPTFAPVAPTNIIATLTQGSTSWTLTFQNGEVRTFDGISGYLTSIADRNGNTTQLSYDTAYRLTTVTDPAGRHLYFTYANSASYLVIEVTSDIGLSLSYTYDSLGRLSKVMKPDQTTVSFQYDSNSLISAVLDTNGKVLESHTYNSCGQGLTSSQAGGIGSLTVSYAPSCGLGLP